MSQPAIGSMELYDDVVPAMSGGRHSVTSTVVVDTATAPAPLNRVLHHDFIQVGTSGLHLQPTEVLACHPPRNGTGGFQQELPHVVLRDRTLPWERTGPGAKTWLALLVFADSEVGFATLPLVSVVGPSAAAAFAAEESVDAPVDAVQVHDPAVLQAVLPQQNELDLLTHVRRVNTADSTLDLDDDDGWLSVVVANRLPLAGPDPVHYHACLVSLEHRDDLYAQPATTSLLLLYRWDFITDTGGTFGALALELDVGTLGAGIDHGETALDVVGREGEPGSGRYRGPFTVEATALPDGTENAGPADPVELSYDAAYELGRLLGAADGPLTRDLVEWHRASAAAATAAVQHARLRAISSGLPEAADPLVEQPPHLAAAAAGLSGLVRSLAPPAPHRQARPPAGRPGPEHAEQVPR